MIIINRYHICELKSQGRTIHNNVPVVLSGNGVTLTLTEKASKNTGSGMKILTCLNKKKRCMLVETAKFPNVACSL